MPNLQAFTVKNTGFLQLHNSWKLLQYFIDFWLSGERSNFSFLDCLCSPYRLTATAPESNVQGCVLLKSLGRMKESLVQTRFKPPLDCSFLNYQGMSKNEMLVSFRTASLQNIQSSRVISIFFSFDKGLKTQLHVSNFCTVCVPL